MVRQCSVAPAGAGQYRCALQRENEVCVCTPMLCSRVGLPSAHGLWYWYVNMRDILLQSITVSFGYLPVMQKKRKGNFKNNSL